MMIADSLYHKSLRVVGVLLAVSLLFESGMMIPGTRDLSAVLSRQFAATIGMSASVEPTELSTVTAELTKRQHELDLREAGIAERELRVTKPVVGNGQIFEYVISAGLFLVLVLLILNYAFDFMRAHRRGTTAYAR